jgi:hypothetical protein
MGTINWSSPVSGLWSSAKDWAGGIVPGAGDFAEIPDSQTSTSYTISVAAATTIGGLTMNDAHATLAIYKSLSLYDLAWNFGAVVMHNGGSLSGIITDAYDQTLYVTGSATLNNVLWTEGAAAQVNIEAASGATTAALTIEGGLRVTSSTGGVGTLSVFVPMVFNNVASLNNEYLRIGEIKLINTPKLTLGANETVFAEAITASNGETITNLGTANVGNIVGGSIDNTGSFTVLGTLAGGSVMNTGTLEFSPAAGFNQTFGLARLQATSLYNDGTLETSGVLNMATIGTLKAAGANGQIVLDNGLAILPNPGSTAAFLQEVLAQHVSGTGSWAVGFAGTLNNAGATLTVGAGTTLGEFGDADYWQDSTLSGGTLVLADAGPNHEYTDYLNLKVANAMILADAPVLEVFNATLTGDTVSGVSTVTVQEYNALTASELTINETTFAGGPVDFNVAAATLTLGNNQSVSGDTISLSFGGVLNLGAESTSNVTFDIGNGNLSLSTDTITGTGGLTASTVVTLAGDTVTLSGIQSNAGHITGSIGGIALTGTFTNSATISLTGANLSAVGTGTLLRNTGVISLVGGTLDVSPTQIVNTGQLSVTNGTLQLEGPLNLASLTAIAHPGSYEEISGTFSLGGKVVSLDTEYNPKLSLVNGQITDGTLAIRAHESFIVTSGGNITGAPESALISANIINNGTLSVTAFSNDFVPVLAGAVSGTGTIAVSQQSDLGISGAIGAQQTLVLHSGETSFGLVTQAAEAGFKATISGFAVADQIALAGTVTSAGFSKSSIVATLSNGTTMALHTTSALTGSLSVSRSGSLSILTYESTNSPTALDWHPATNAPQPGSVDLADGALLGLHSPVPGWQPFLHLHAI